MSKQFLDMAMKYDGCTEDNDLLINFCKKFNGTKINLRKTSWCAIFIGSVLNACGYIGTHSMMARSYLKWGIPILLKDLQPGDIMIKKRGLPWQGHVTISTGKFSIEENWFEGCGGNQDNIVRIKRYPLNTLIGIRREGK